METPRIIIAIDGFSSCGKSTMAKELARRIGYTYIDSGAMYRAVTLYCLQHGIITGDAVDTQRLEAEINNIHITFATDSVSGKQMHLPQRRVCRTSHTQYGGVAPRKHGE